MTPPAPSVSAPFTRYARVFLDVMPALRTLPAWQRWVYLEAVALRDRSPRPISRSEIAKATGDHPRNVAKALAAAARLKLVQIERVKGENGVDLGMRLTFPWGGHGVPTSPGHGVPTSPGHAVPTSPGHGVPTPPGHGVPTSRPALLFVPDPSQIDPRDPTPTPALDPSRARTHESESQGGGKDDASRSWDRSWSVESIRDVLALFPNTPERGGLTPKWLAKIVHRGDPTLRELRAYLRHASKVPDVLAWKYPLAGACDPERWDAWLANHRAAKLAAERAEQLEAAGPELASKRLASKLDAVRRTKRTPTDDATRPSASKSNDAVRLNASCAADAIATLERAPGSPARRLSASRSA